MGGIRARLFVARLTPGMFLGSWRPKPPPPCPPANGSFMEPSLGTQVLSTKRCHMQFVRFCVPECVAVAGGKRQQRRNCEDWALLTFPSGCSAPSPARQGFVGLRSLFLYEDMAAVGRWQPMPLRSAKAR